MVEVSPEAIGVDDSPPDVVPRKTSYVTFDVPPKLVGAVHERSIAPLAGVAFSPVGAPGTVVLTTSENVLFAV